MAPNKLEEYRKKRNFRETPEPAGGKKDMADFSAFVVQKHSATALHYDLRLEYKGVLLSWAVPKGFSYDPSVKHLAEKVEDHPFSYKNFEGVIPEGNYGAGPVMVWDRGYFSVEGKDKETTESNLEKGLRKGHFAFTLAGQKLKGDFILAKLKGDNDWIIFKKKDQYSLEPPKINEQSILTGRSMDEIKFGEKSPMPHDIKPMMAETAKEPFDKESWIFEIKWDGYRAIAEIENGKVNLYSRNLKSFNEKFPIIKNAIKNITKNAILDGEIVILNKEGKPDFQALQDYSKNKSGTLAYCLFDLIYFDGHDLRQKPLIERKNILREIIDNIPYLQYSDHIENEGRAFFRKATESGLEGIMAKDGASPYLDGKRSEKWQKIKNVLTAEAVIGGYTQGESGRPYFSSLILGMYSSAGDLQFVGQVGSGFDEKKIINLFDIFKQLIQKKSPFKEIPKTNRTPVWLEPKLVCTIKYAEFTKEGILRQPVFLYLRGDIGPEEVLCQQIK